MGTDLLDLAGVGLLEYGIAGIFILVLIVGFFLTARSAQRERNRIEERDEVRETALRAAVSKSFDERHDDSVDTNRRLARIEAKMRIDND